MKKMMIESLGEAFEEIKGFNPDEWEGDYREAARDALRGVLEGRMASAVDAYLEEVRRRDVPDRRNGYYFRHILTELGDLEIRVPRTRTFSPCGILRGFARGGGRVERMILLAFVLGLSTRKVGRALLPILGEVVSAQRVSRVARQLDAQVEAYHRRPLEDRYRVLILDGIVMKRKSGVGAQRRSVLVALGILEDGRKEVIDFRQASSESQVAWEGFLRDLYRRGLVGEGLELIVVDGGGGLLSAIEIVYGQVPLQRCWTHKTRNVLSYVRRGDREAVRRGLHRISHAPDLVRARGAARRFIKRWEGTYPRAARCLARDLPELLTFLTVRLPLKPSGLRTTNAIERRFREVRRRTRPMGTFSDRTSIERIMLSVFTYENLKQKTAAPFPLTQNL